MQSKFYLFFLILVGLTVQVPNAIAQIAGTRPPVADNTLGTNVSLNGNNFEITGGLSRGAILFHSFNDFSVPTNSAANFVHNPTVTRDIIARVTGSSFSDINGAINTKYPNFSGANFFLINPNGITFGPNASLNVGRAFVASTADGINLSDGNGGSFTFRTKNYASGDTALLNVSPSVLFLSSLNMGGGSGSIINYGTLQTTNLNQYIGLIGGNVTLDGGRINAPGGRVELGGLSAQGTVKLGNINNLNVELPINVARGDVSLTNGAIVTVTGSGGGDIAITARNIDLLGGSIVRGGIETGLGTPEAIAGDIRFNATGEIGVGSQSAILNNVRPNSKGQGGNVSIEASSFSLRDSGLSASTSGKGNAGNVTVKVTGYVDIAGSGSVIGSIVVKGGEGNAGNIIVDAGSISLSNGAQLTASTFGQGNAGNITVKANDSVFLSGVQTTIFSNVVAGGVGNAGNITVTASSLSLQNGSQLAASTFGQGNAGDITVKANDAVSLSGRQTTIFSTVDAGGVGRGGNIDITAGSLSLQNGSQLSTITRGANGNQLGGKGDAGNVTVKATGSVDIAGEQSSISSSIGMGAVGNGGNVSIEADSLSLQNGGQLTATTRGQGNAGSITIDTGSFFLRDGAQITASTFGQGNAGSVKMTAKDTVTLAGAAIFSTVEAGSVGNGGNIDITAGSLSLQNGAQLQTLTNETDGNLPAGKGNAGNVTVKVAGAVDITGTKNGVASGIRSSVDTGAVGNGGSINVEASSLSLQNGAQITASTSGNGNAGNVHVKVTDAVKFRGIEEGSVSQIRSIVNAGAIGNGGNIVIEAGSLSLQDSAQIATSTFGKGNAGNVTVTAKDTVSLTGGQTTIFSAVEAGGVGNGGNIMISADALSIKDGAQLQTIINGVDGNQPAGKGNAGNVTVNVTGAVNIAGTNGAILSFLDKGSVGNAGNITIDSGSFSLRDGARLSSSTSGQGNAGNINVKARESVAIIGEASAIFSTVEAGGDGKGGNININAGSLSIKDGAQLQTRTLGAEGNQLAGKGDAGNVNIKVTGDVDIVGSKNGFNSKIISSVDTGTEGNGGNITVDAGSFSLRDGARLESITKGKGNSGTITVNANDFVNIAHQPNQFTSGLFVTSLSSTGKAGDIFLTSPKITLDRGILESASLSGNGGNIQIGGILPSEFASIQGSQINPNKTELLLLRNGAQISTDAKGTAQVGSNGGNIAIDSKLIVAVPKENSDITARAVQGRGGNVNINSQGLFGIESRKQLTNNSDITASSDFGQTGNVNITTPGTDPGKDSNQLPNVPNDASNQISQACSTNTRDNKLTVTGRGGLPPNANDTLNVDVVWQDARAPQSQPTSSSATTTNPFKLAPPAVGWVFDGKGKVTLIAASTQGQPTGTSVACPKQK